MPLAATVPVLKICENVVKLEKVALRQQPADRHCCQMAQILATTSIFVPVASLLIN